MPNIKSQKDRVVQAKKEALQAAVVAIDKAAAKGVLHKNTASRKVSRLAKAADKAGK